MTGSIGKRLEEIREEMDLSLRDMAKKVGVSVSTWQRLIADGNPPKGETLLRLADMGFSSDWILTGEGPMHAPGLAEQGQEAFTSSPTGSSNVSDPELLALINDTITRVYEDEGNFISPADMGRVAAKKYAAILNASNQPDERRIMVKLFEAELRQQVQETHRDDN